MRTLKWKRGFVGLLVCASLIMMGAKPMACGSARRKAVNQSENLKGIELSHLRPCLITQAEKQPESEEPCSTSGALAGRINDLSAFEFGPDPLIVDKSEAYLVFKEEALGQRILHADSYLSGASPREGRATELTLGKVFQPLRGMFRINISEALSLRYEDMDPLNMPLLRLRLVFDDGRSVLVNFHVRLISQPDAALIERAVPYAVSALEQSHQFLHEGLVVRKQILSNLSARPVRVWLRARSSNLTAYSLALSFMGSPAEYRHNVTQPERTISEAKVGLHSVRVSRRDSNGLDEVTVLKLSSSGDAQGWVSFELKPEEKVGLEWVAVPLQPEKTCQLWHRQVIVAYRVLCELNIDGMGCDRLFGTWIFGKLGLQVKMGDHALRSSTVEQSVSRAASVLDEPDSRPFEWSYKEQKGLDLSTPRGCPGVYVK